MQGHCGQEDLVRFRRTAAAERVRAPEFAIGGQNWRVLNLLVSLESFKTPKKKTGYHSF